MSTSEGSDSEAQTGGAVPWVPVVLGHLGGQDAVEGGCDTCWRKSFATAALIALVIVMVIILLSLGSKGRGGEGFCRAEAPIQSFDHPEWSAPSELQPSDVTPDIMWTSPAATIGLADAEVQALKSQPPERKSVYKTLARLYSTADVDPLISGQAYAYRDYTRPIYDQRSSHGGVWGLQEFSSSSNPGDVGADVGPEGLEKRPPPGVGMDAGPDALAEYEGSVHGYDDGIPAEWAFPATPIRWYKPLQRDYYGPEGPTPYADGMFNLFTPDHDPLIGEDENPDY